MVFITFTLVASSANKDLYVKAFQIIVSNILELVFWQNIQSNLSDSVVLLLATKPPKCGTVNQFKLERLNSFIILKKEVKARLFKILI